jgi:hypothetical protein
VLHDHPQGALLSNTERAALLGRLATRSAKTDWAAYERDLDIRIGAITRTMAGF